MTRGVGPHLADRQRGERGEVPDDVAQRHAAVRGQRGDLEGVITPRQTRGRSFLSTV